MERRPLIAIVVVVMLAVIGFVIYSALPPSEAGHRAVQQLQGVQTFSFGPVGAAGSIPEREDAFFVILSSRHSSALFRELFERGTPEARLYALCGLQLTRGGFDAHAARFVREATNVSTMGGCIGRDCTSAEAVTAIRQGVIEHYLPLRREIERARIEYARTNKPAA